MANPVKDDSRRSYGIVIRKTWRSTRFRNKSNFYKLLLTYLWSCPAGENSASIFYLALPTIADDLGTDTETVTRTVQEMVAEGWFEYDAEARVFFLPRQIEFDRPDNPNILKAFIKRSIELPETPLLLKYYQQLKPFLERFAEGFPEELVEQVENRLANSIPNPVPVPTPEPSPKPEPKPKKLLSGKPDSVIPFDEIVQDLNQVVGKQFKPDSKETRGHIKARWAEGFRLEDFKTVHRNKAAKWLCDSKMSDFLRPETLYSKKFESYLNDVPTKSISDVTRRNMENYNEMLKKLEAKVED